MNQETYAELVPASNTTPGIETFIIQPPGLDVALRVTIAQPAKPAMGHQADDPIAVVYAIDADYSFGRVVEIARLGGSSGNLAPAIVVGIGYAKENGDFEFSEKRRILDYYRGPRRSYDMGAYGSMEFGGADAFLAALRDHIIPAVEQRVPGIDPTRRILLGTSAGGHFASYVLTQEPGLFQGYALMSPILTDYPPSTGDGALVRLVADLPEGTLSPDMRVFLSAGAREEDPGTMFASFSIISNAYRMRTALAQHGIATEFVQFADETHVSVSSAALSRALCFLLPPLHPELDWEAALAATNDGTKE